MWSREQKKEYKETPANSSVLDKQRKDFNHGLMIFIFKHTYG